MDFDVTINLLTGAVINDTILGVADLGEALLTGILTSNAQTLPNVRANGYDNVISATNAVNYSPYIIGTISIVEQV
jgi:hypothetical protein